MRVRELIDSALDVVDKSVCVVDQDGNDLQFDLEVDARHGLVFKTEAVSVEDLIQKDADIEELQEEIKSLNLKIAELEMSLGIESSLRG